MLCVFVPAGMHFSQAVAIIQSQVGIIKGVQVLYSDTVRIPAERMRKCGPVLKPPAVPA